jgi:hypothetical protein
VELARWQIAAQKDKMEKQAEEKQKREVLVATTGKRAERDARGPMLAFRGSLTSKTKDDLSGNHHSTRHKSCAEGQSIRGSLASFNSKVNHF